MMNGADSFTNFLESRREHRFGLCMFVPAVMGPAANRFLNSAYGDSGDNLSVPMGRSNERGIVQYLAGNYSAASYDHTIGTLAAFEHIPGAVMLITEPGVGASAAATYGLLENGHVRQWEGARHSFYTFARDHLRIERIDKPTDEIDQFMEFGITIKAEILTPNLDSRIFLRTPWEAIFREIIRDPKSIFKFKDDPRAFEKFIADTYRLDGYDVQLTPRSNDGGVDVIAAKGGFGAIKIFDQAKAYSEGRRVPANDVRAAYGVLSMSQDTSKVVITTTSEFAPGVYDEFAKFMPTRVELRHGQNLIHWLKQVEGNLRG